MTNEEIIREIRNLADKHEYDSVLTFDTNYHMAFTDIANHIEEQAEENTTHKTEIEQLKERLEIKDNNFELYSDALDEIEQLKSELAQLKPSEPKHKPQKFHRFKDGEHKDVDVTMSVYNKK